MPASIPPSIEAYLASRPNASRIIPTLVDKLTRLGGLQVHAYMASSPAGEPSFPILEFEFRAAHVLAFRISIKDDIIFHFMTKQDCRKFKARLSGTDESPNKAGPKWNPSTDFRLEKDASIPSKDADANSLSEALIAIAAATPMRKIIPMPSDRHIESKIKGLYGSRDAYLYETFIEDIANYLTESNLEAMLDLLEEIDPWADEDAEHVADTQLLVLSVAINEQKRHLPEATESLLKLRTLFETYAGDALEDVAEIDTLLNLLKGKSH